MGRIFQPARMAQAGEGVPLVQAMKYATGQVYLKGALVIDDANGELVECGADPAAILGVSLQACGTGLGYGSSNETQIVYATGRQQVTSIAIATRVVEFSGRAVNGGTDPVTPLQTHIGEVYGVLRTAAGEWVIDMAETTNTRLEITDIVEADGVAGGFFLFKFLEANLARP